jgi:acetyl-CoA C-acetyltransferase
VRPVHIYDAIRSPRGRAKTQGGLHDLTPQALLKQLYQHLEQRTGLDPKLVGDVLLGCVTQHGEQAANIARTSALYAGWPPTAGGLTLNRFCSSSLDAIAMGALKIAAGQERAVVAGGVEMMSRVPMLSDGARVFNDPAFAVRCQVLLMGSGADLIASLNNVSREAADAVALASQRRAATAQAQGRFTSIVPVHNPVKGIEVSQDECIRAEMNAEQLAALPAAFAEPGAAGADAVQLAGHPQMERVRHIHTAGNSPAMADAASLVLLGSEDLGRELGVPPRGRILASVNAFDDPLQVLGGCIAATRKLMQEQSLGVEEIDLFEIHEAFAATMVRLQREIAIPDDKLNVNGGCIALGHPMGATGAIMAGTLLDELERRDARLGIVAASGAAGSGSALLLER